MGRWKQTAFSKVPARIFMSGFIMVRNWYLGNSCAWISDAGFFRNGIFYSVPQGFISLLFISFSA
jgi:hypothetical protein